MRGGTVEVDFDQIYLHVIKPAIQSLQIECFRAMNLKEQKSFSAILSLVQQTKDANEKPVCDWHCGIKFTNKTTAK
jgi:hypothetical protein